MEFLTNNSVGVTVIKVIINYIIFSIGLWKLYGKCELEKKWALVPVYRIKVLAEYVDHEEDGVNYYSSYIIYAFFNLSNTILFLVNPNHVKSTMIFDALMLIFSIAYAVYLYRIASGLCDVFQIKKKKRVLWSIAWILFTEYVSVIWGFLKCFQPVKEKPEESVSAKIDGTNVQMMNRGLTVNLTDRSVRQHMKTRYLLRDVHLNIKPGTMVLLLGGSGAGKTTFLNAITGYEPANAVITLDGEDVYKNFDKMKYKIGFVPQQDLIRYEDTIEKTLADAAALRLSTGYSAKERMERVNSVLEIFGLTAVRGNIVGKQSGGQKKRISIAMEYISDPSLFILDEPDSGLDGILARDLMRRLHDISREGKTVIVITHTPDRVIEYFDEIIVLGKDANRTGRLVFHGSIEKAREFFNVSRMEEIVRKINCIDEGGEGLADQLIEKFAEVRYGE